jgi:predicted nuclease of restriction endonuclease-like (RecB) superfamily
MSEINLFDEEYKTWITDLKNKIRSTQIKAALVVNTVLIEFYWEIGKMISEKQNVWGAKLIEQVAKDLKAEFPDIRGFSRSNLFYCKQFYLFYANPIVQQAVGQIEQNDSVPSNSESKKEIVHQAVGLINQQEFTKIPWSHNILIFTKSQSVQEAVFYINETIINNWSRDVLALQIKTDLYKRQGKAISNFAQTLPDPFSDLAQQTLKDPYVFDFMTMAKPFHEKDIERQLISHITKFLLELGKGFAFVGQQYHLEIANNDYYIDMLFYHTRLKCYVVIELKNTKFIPEYAGKLNFYLSAVDSLLKQSDDKNTIGILLCRDKNNIEAEFALRDINKPMGISEFQFTEILPDELKSSLPTIEEIENELKNLEE